jgi:uncharacterized protein (DUF488 family)
MTSGFRKERESRPMTLPGIRAGMARKREQEESSRVRKDRRPMGVVLTVGHSTSELGSFIDLLQEHGVEKLVDIRTVPRSRHNPQFNRETLPDHLKAAGIGYIHLAGLGGLRHGHRDSPNGGWRNSSFRGFADYMQTEGFQKNLERLIDLSKREQVVLMCAEALPWRCHRFLVADALKIRGIVVEHIMTKGKRQLHPLTPWAHVDGNVITYPPPEASAEM